MESKALETMKPQEMLRRVQMAKFPQQLTPQEQTLLAEAAITYGFDPLMGELTIYQGSPYVSIDGRLRKAQETNQLAGIRTRPATKEEKTAWGYPEEDFFFHADIYLKSSEMPFEGWGRVSKIEIDRAIKQATGRDKDPWFLPVVKDPQGMAEKRAIAKALKRAFHIPLPSREDIGGDEDVAPVQATRIVVETKADPQTGEIINPPVQQASKATGDQVDLCKLEFANPLELFAAANKHFNLSKVQVQKEVPEFDLSNTAQRARAWLQLLAVYGPKTEVVK